MPDASNRTVVVALCANVAVAAAKFVGAALTGSAALFAEGAESVSDTLNELFLLRSLYRSRRPADAEHPFGYGRERFFWALLAAFGIFVSGAGFSGFEAFRAFTGSPVVGPDYYLIAYCVLGFVLLAEGTSWLRAVRQVSRDAEEHGRGWFEHIRMSSDPSVKNVAGEDTTAVLGVFVAAGGIALHQVTGSGWWEGVASAVIAVLMVVTAFLLGRDVKDLLIGKAADPALRRELLAYLDGCDAVDRVVELLTLRLGARDVMVATRVDLDSSLDSDAVETASAEIDREINRRWPQVTQVFLDATRSDEVRASRAQPVGKATADPRR
jgi:cation diffusion facilitator family transporter